MNSKLAFAVILLGTANGSFVAAEDSPKQSLDFGYYRTHVEPLFLKKRPSHARCVVCHAGSTNAFHLQPLPAGGSTWTEEQSRRNFEIVSRLVTRGDPAASRLLLHPLSPTAGGDPFPQRRPAICVRDDPDWQVLANSSRSSKRGRRQRPDHRLRNHHHTVALGDFTHPRDDGDLCSPRMCRSLTPNSPPSWQRRVGCRRV